jgi:hypothetical protein
MAMPSKLYEYLSTGLPVIYGGDGPAKNILSEFENVTVVPPDEPRMLNENLVKMSTYINAAQNISNIVKIQKNFIREDQVNIFIHKLLKNKTVQHLDD